MRENETERKRESERKIVKRECTNNGFANVAETASAKRVLISA